MKAKIKSVFLAAIIGFFLSTVLMRSALYGSEQEETIPMTEAEAREWVNVTYKGLSKPHKIIHNNTLLQSAHEK